MSHSPDPPATTAERPAETAPSDLQCRRLAIATLRTEAEDFGRPWLAAAFRRLALMCDVEECLAEESPSAAVEVAAFNAVAYERLTDVTADDEHEQAAAWVCAESAARWGEYLALLDPSGSSIEPGSPLGPAIPEPPLDDQPAAIDAATLFRMLTGDAAPGFPDRGGDTGESRPLIDLHAPPPASGAAHDQSANDQKGVAGVAVSRPRKPAAPTDVVPSVRRGLEEETPATQAASQPGARRSRPRANPPARPRPEAQPVFEVPAPPSSVVIDPELSDVFLAEATDLFERIESIVLGLVRGPSQGDRLHELGRCLHTLKGAAGSVELTQLAALIHAMEEQLEAAAGEVSDTLIDLLHSLLRYMDGVFFALCQGGVAPAAPAAQAPPPEPEEAPPRPPRGIAVEPSFQVVHQTPATPTSGPAQAPAASGAPPAAGERAGGEGPLRVSAERIDELMDIASELISRRGLWSAQSESMREFGTLARTCRTRLMTTVDQLRDLCPAPRAADGGPAALNGQGEAYDLMRRLIEQSDDLVVLIETAQAAAKPLSDCSDLLARQTLQLWEALQAIRIVPVRGLFQRLTRVAQDAARVEQRQVEVVTVGEETGLDRAVQDKAFEPLLHVVRNAVGHGIEPPDERVRLGKPPTGRVTLEASRRGNTLILSVQDDGRGLDYEAIAAKGRRLGLIGLDDRPSDDRLCALIFQSGFSTREAANSVAGRGVGMDVVSQEVGRLHGTVTLASQTGQGMRLCIHLPARLALEQAMVLRVDGQAFALPVELIELAEALEPAAVEWSGPYPRVRMRDELVPLVSTREALGFPPAALVSCPRVLLIRADGQPLAVLVDAIDGTRELVIKPLGPLLSGHPLVSGTSLSVTGEVVFSLNPAGLAWWVREGAAAGGPISALTNSPQVAPILVVDDSISVRKVVARQLRARGFEVEEGSDGLEALGKIRNNTYGLVISDLEMPRMDGFELLAELSRLTISPAVPVLVASTRSDPETRRRVIGLGARDFLAKPIDADELATKVERLLREPVAAVPDEGES